MKIYGTRWSRLCGGQDEGSKTEMVRIVKRRCTDVPVKRCEKLAGVGETLYTRSISKSCLPTGKCDSLPKSSAILTGTSWVSQK
uniref:Putative ovule protein n=1 Tax=Solanum chacoense TaxID=4108 RepID=A0A0V0HLJ4_SOLCH